MLAEPCTASSFKDLSVRDLWSLATAYLRRALCWGAAMLLVDKLPSTSVIYSHDLLVRHLFWSLVAMIAVRYAGGICEATASFFVGFAIAGRMMRARTRIFILLPMIFVIFLAQLYPTATKIALFLVVMPVLGVNDRYREIQ